MSWQGVAWMILRERNNDLPPLWKKITENGVPVFFNEITKCATLSQPNKLRERAYLGPQLLLASERTRLCSTSYLEAPPPVTGGLLCDDMGLGKTLQVLALIILNPPHGVSYGTSAQESSSSKCPKRVKVHSQVHQLLFSLGSRSCCHIL